MIVIVSVAEIRNFTSELFISYTSRRHGHNYTWSYKNQKTDFIYFLDWVFKRYFVEYGFRVMSYVHYDDLDLLFKDEKSQLMGHIDYFIQLRAPMLFNLIKGKRNYLLSLIVSNNDLVISLESDSE